MVRKQKFKGKTLLRKRCVDNILKVYNDARFEGGENWYLEANLFAENLGVKFGLTKIQVAGIIAALSPLKSWNENNRITETFLTNGNGMHTQAMKDKAKAIKTYESSMQREFILNTLNGNKIKNFFLNIAYPMAQTHVTIDRHAIAIILGRSIKENEGAGITNIQYEFLASCYRDAAEILGVLPNVVQSVTWVKWRKIKQANKFSEVPF